MSNMIESAAEAIAGLSRAGYPPAECMNRLPVEFYEMSGLDLAAAFRRSAEILTQEADELCRLVEQRRA